jgi:uncharacterized protein (TIGR02996 family)
MTERDFRKAILANPADRSVRLVYADWLEERGDPRGEYLRLETERGDIQVSDGKHCHVQERLNSLRGAFDRQWVLSVGLFRICTVDDLVFYLRTFLDLSSSENSVHIPDDVPYGLALIYRELGALFEAGDVFGTQDSLSSLSRLRRVNGMVEFAWENQGCWSCRFPAGEADPPVYSNAPDLWTEGPNRGHQKVCGSLNHFLVTLCLQEAVMSSPCLLALDDEKVHAGRAAHEVFERPCRPLWLNGYYVGNEASHDFFDVPGQGVLLMDWSGSLWVGLQTDEALTLIDKDITYRRIT